jgi:hypothetical protein
MASAPLVPCPSCARHVRTDEGACPFCASPLPDDLAARAVPAAPRRLSRAAAFVFGATITTAACSGNVVQDVDGGGATGSGGSTTTGAGGTTTTTVTTGVGGSTTTVTTTDTEPEDAGFDGQVAPPYGLPPYGQPPPQDGG